MMDCLGLDYDEIVIIKESCVAYGGTMSTCTSELYLTNKKIICVHKGIFGGTKATYHFPLDQIKIYKGVPQVQKGKLSNGTSCLEIYFVFGEEQFYFQSRNKQTIDKWILEINKELGISPVNVNIKGKKAKSSEKNDSIAASFKEIGNEFKEIGRDIVESFGSQVDDTAKFCGVCGNKMTVQSPKTNVRKTIYDGTIHKCPNCGVGLASFVKNCPECGYELRGTDGVESVSDFARRYAEATTNDKKVDLIRTFVIPNTKEDILEFSILASSNVDVTAYSRDNIIISGGVSQQEVSEAWMAKFEQAYQKAAILLNGEPELKKIEELFEKKKKSLSTARVTSVGGKVVKGIFGNDTVKILLLCFLPLIILLIICGVAIGSSERKLEKQVKQVEAYISEGNYDAALIEAYAMDDNYSNSWTETRDNLISRIKELQGQSESHEGQARVPTKSFLGDQYVDAVNAFEAAGFTNVKTEPYKYDFLSGWMDKLMDTEGEVKEISVNGETSYNKGAWLSADAPIIIRYLHK